jgi:hypothetical protein
VGSEVLIDSLKLERDGLASESETEEKKRKERAHNDLHVGTTSICDLGISHFLLKFGDPRSGDFS